MRPHPFIYAPRRVVSLVLFLGLAAALVLGAAGCGKKPLAPSRYGGAPATSGEQQAWSPPPAPAQAIPEQDLGQQQALPEAQPPVYTSTGESVPVFEDVYQLASFSQQEYATGFERQARDTGFDVRLEDAMVNGQTYYRVIGSIRGTEDEIKQSLAKLGVNPVQRSRMRIEGATTPYPTGSAYAPAAPETAPGVSAAPYGNQTAAPYGSTWQEPAPSTAMSSGAPAQLEGEQAPAYDGTGYASEDVQVPPPPGDALAGSAAQTPQQQDPLLGPSYRAPMQQQAPAATNQVAAGTQTASVSKRAVSEPQAKSGIIPPSAPPTFAGSAACQEKNGNLVASAVGRADEPLRAERIAVDQAKRSLLLCVQAYQDKEGLSSGARLTEVPIQYLLISDPQRRPDGSVFVSVGIAIEDIPKLSAGR